MSGLPLEREVSANGVIGDGSILKRATKSIQRTDSTKRS